MKICYTSQNAKVRKGEDKECSIGPYGLGIRNGRGDMLATYCQANDLTATNTLFNHRYIRRYIWISPGIMGIGHKNLIDYILTCKCTASCMQIDDMGAPCFDSRIPSFISLPASCLRTLVHSFIRRKIKLRSSAAI